jgi:putative spermidine/putrescine transport system substrate-binding protein
MNRSQWIGIAAVTAIVLTFLYFQFIATSGLTFVAWGGSTQQALNETMWSPFAEQGGVTYNEDTFGGQYSLVKQKAESPDGQWDVVEVTTTTVLEGVAESLYVELPKGVRNVGGLKPEAARRHAVGVFEWWTAMAWNEKRIPSGVSPPSSWKDFWNVEKYPGTRGFRRSPRTTLEIALLADGVNPDSLYPLDVDRALSKLSEIRDNIVWWETGADLQTRLLNRYTMTSAWSGRVWTLISKEQPVDMTLRGALADRDWWVILKNSEYKQEAIDFLEYSVQPEVQTRFANATGYGPVNEQSYTALSDSAQQYIPAPSDTTIVEFNAKWWSENESQVREKWNSWLRK